jgi:hypothetical protein
MLEGDIVLGTIALVICGLALWALMSGVRDEPGNDD